MLTPREIWDHDVSRWILDKVPHLSTRSKYCAANSIRFARWAGELREVSPPLATFSAIHAVEEAVAAFVWAAKAHGHKRSANEINLRVHESKAVVSIFAKRARQAAASGRLAIAISPDGDCLGYRVPKGDGYRYGELHLSALHISDADEDVEGIEYLGPALFSEEIEAEINKTIGARNGTLYASKDGVPTGFVDAEDIAESIVMSLGLIWASIDLHRDPEKGGSFVAAMLDGMIEVNKGRKKGAQPLDEELGFKAMQLFLEVYWERASKASDDLAVLLRSLEIDPAQRSDWADALHRAGES
jgi:hypothetical protein